MINKLFAICILFSHYLYFSSHRFTPCKVEIMMYCPRSQIHDSIVYLTQMVSKQFTNKQQACLKLLFVVYPE